MNWISSVLVFGLTLTLFFKYRPREETSLQLCALCGFLALVTPLAPCNTWFLQMISLSTKALALVCCFLQLRRESCRRKAAARAHRTPAKKEPHLPAA